MRLKINLAQSLTAAEIEALILELPEIQKWTEGATPKKIIVVHGKIINIVL
jgi:leucyl-tRNA synthetase